MIKSIREKLAVETENKKQTRLENARKYKKRKQAEKTVTENNENQVQIEQSRSNNIVNQQDYLKEFDIKKNGSIHDQSWTKATITKFHKSIQHAISQCTICQEAWPLKSKANQLVIMSVHDALGIKNLLKNFL